MIMDCQLKKKSMSEIKLMPEIKLILPWPPSVNHYWLASGKRRYVSKEGIDYAMIVKSLVPRQHVIFTGRLSLYIEAHPPDNRIRDLDNTLKCTLDSLEKAKVFKNDSQIDEIHIIRMSVRKNGGSFLISLKPFSKVLSKFSIF